jgi:hypothetical protein
MKNNVDHPDARARCISSTPANAIATAVSSDVRVPSPLPASDALNALRSAISASPDPCRHLPNEHQSASCRPLPICYLERPDRHRLTSVAEQIHRVSDQMNTLLYRLY